MASGNQRVLALSCCISPCRMDVGAIVLTGNAWAESRESSVIYISSFSFCFGDNVFAFSVILSAVGKLPRSARAVSMNHSWRLI